MRAQRGGFAKGLAVSLAVFALLIGGGAALFGAVGQKSGEAELQLVRDAVRRAVVTCYAAEGAYPAGLDYLKENYGLVYDEENYFVSYDAFASNVMPGIRVTERGAAQ